MKGLVWLSLLLGLGFPSSLLTAQSKARTAPLKGVLQATIEVVYHWGPASVAPDGLNEDPHFVSCRRGRLPARHAVRLGQHHVP